MSGQRVGYKHLWPIAGSVVAGFLFATMIAFFIQQAEQSELKAEFVHAGMDELLAIQTNLTWHLELLATTTAFYHVAPTATAQELSTFVKPLLKSRPGIERVEWLSQVPAAEESSYIQTHYSDQPLLIQDTQHDFSNGQVPVQILQPILFTPTTTITGPLAFASAAGFVAVELSLDQVIANALDKISATHIHFDLYNIAQQKLVYHYPPQLTSAHDRPTFVAVTQLPAQAFLIKEEFTILGQQWLVVLEPTDAYLAQNQPQFHWLILLSSLGITACLVTYLYVLLNRQKQSEQDLRERTEQLRQANQRLQETLQELQFQKTLLECTSEAAQDGVLVVSPERQWLFFNRQFVEMWQIPPSLVAQRSSYEAIRWALTQVQDAQHVRERMEKLYAQPDAYATEEVYFKNGTILERFSAPVNGADGAHFGRVWYYRDITQRKRTEEALRQSEARNRAFVNAIPDLLFRMNRDGTFLDYHSAPGYLPVMPPEEFLGRNAVDVFAAPVAQALKERIIAVLSTGKIKIIEYDMPMLNGEKRSWEQRMVMLSEDEVMLIIRDVTARKQAEAALRLSQQQLQERQQRERELAEEELARLRNQLVINTRFATLGQVAATIAHELRNPLGAVRNAVYYIRRYLVQDHQEMLDFLQIIDMEITTADRIITDLLEMTRAKEPAIQPLDLGLIAQEIWHRSKQTNKIAFRCTVPYEPFWVSADSTQLRQVLANLITNAIQAMPDDGTLSITGEEQLDCVMITVQDSGSGVPVAVRDRIFEPLFTTKAKGTGLGLAICRQIIERHGGTIELGDSSQGAKFVIRLPIKPVATMASMSS